MNQLTHELSLTSDQAGGAVSKSIETKPARGRHWRHSLQAEVTTTATGALATPTAGTLTVKGKAPNGAGFQTLGTIALTAPDPVIFEGFYEAIEAVSTGLDADKTWTLNITSGD